MSFHTAILKDLRSNVLAAICGLAIVGISGHPGSAVAEQVNPPGKKVYADMTGFAGRSGTTASQTKPAVPSEENAWQNGANSGGPAMCDMRCRTGFFGYR
jgi:hypothetical protein